MMMTMITFWRRRGDSSTYVEKMHEEKKKMRERLCVGIVYFAVAGLKMIMKTMMMS